MLQWIGIAWIAVVLIGATYGGLVEFWYEGEWEGGRARKAWLLAWRIPLVFAGIVGAFALAFAANYWLA